MKKTGSKMVFSGKTSSTLSEQEELKKKEDGPAKPRSFPGLLLVAFRILKSSDPLRLAGATAFFTCFALSPILIILVQVFSLFLGERAIGSEVREVLVATFGRDGSAQIRATIRGMREIAASPLLAAGGFVFLVFISTTLFTVIKNSLNDIWKIKISARPGLIFNLWARARGFTVIMITGLLFLAAVFIDSVGVFAGDQIEAAWPGWGRYFKGIWSEVAGIIVIITWFLVLFRFLADGKPEWRACIWGGVLTGILFSAGKLGISSMLKSSKIVHIYGASASIVLILLFVFYSSFILYYGAAFIKAYTENRDRELKPGRKAFRFEVHEVGGKFEN
jgi:membrane protein